MNVPAVGRRRGSSMAMSLSWMVMLAALSELTRGEWAEGRELRERYNHKAAKFGYERISPQTMTAMLLTMASRGLIERTPPKGSGHQRQVRATVEGLMRLEQARMMLDCLEGK